MRTIEEINKIFDMVNSEDEELQNLGLSIMCPKLDTKTLHYITRDTYIRETANKLAQEAYKLGFEYGTEIIKKYYGV